MTDPITSEVLRNSLINIVMNMENGLLRTAFSVVARDLRDIACAIHTTPEDGCELVAVAAGVPILAVVSHFGLQENLAEFGLEQLRPGDEIIFNDPFRGGNHCPDVTIARPVFDDEGLLAFVTSRAHWVDVGGVSPGSWPVGGSVRTIMEETSLRLPPMFLYREGVAVKSTHSLILDGTRAPVQVLGDMRAQHTANLIGERELLALSARYGRATVKDAMRYTLDYGETRMRAALADIPDGAYSAEEAIDDDGVGTRPYVVRSVFTVKGDNAELNFNGTDRQTVGNSSSAWGMSAACSLVSVLGLADPTLSANGGAFRPIDLILPRGSLVHALPYHACADGNGTISVRIESSVIKMMNQARPDHAVGDSYGSAGVFNIGGLEDQRTGKPTQPWFYFHNPFSGWGATSTNDGQNYVMQSLANCIDPPVEALEQESPVIIVSKEFAEDSGGPGQFRGGMGTRYGIGFMSDGVAASSTDRVRKESFGPFEARGGNRSYIERTTGLAESILGTAGDTEPVTGLYHTEGEDDQFMTGKFLGKPVLSGQVWYQYMPGGGGWGSPLDRDPETVALDVRNGLVSDIGAREDYGVVLTAEHTVDLAATTALRAKVRNDAHIAGPSTWAERHLDEHDHVTAGD